LKKYLHYLKSCDNICLVVAGDTTTTQKMHR
jgi:hypothetical protein